MATKWKNKRMALIAWVVLAGLAAVTLVTAGDIWTHRAFLKNNYYFESRDFQEQLRAHTNLIEFMHGENRGYTSLTAEEKVGKEMLARWDEAYAAMLKRSRERIQAAHNERLEQAVQQGQGPGELGRIRQELQLDLAKAEAEVASLKQKRMAEYVAYRDKQYEEAEQDLRKRAGSVQYYIRDKSQGDSYTVYTNMQSTPIESNLKDDSLYSLKLPQTFPTASEYERTLNQYFQAKQWEGFLIVPLEPKGYSQIHRDAVYFDSLKSRIVKELGLLAGCLLGMVLLGYYLYRAKAALGSTIPERVTAWVSEVPLDARLVLTMVLGLAAAGLVDGIAVFTMPPRPSELVSLALLAGCLGGLLLLGRDAVRLAVEPGSIGTEWERSITRRVQGRLADRTAHRSLMFKAVLVMAATVGLGFVISGPVSELWMGLGHDEMIVITSIYGVLYCLTVVPYVLRRVRTLDAILAGVSRMTEGQIHVALPEKGRGSLSRLAHGINNMREGLQTALESRMKSERMKTELITNVSHDLKTPLTSIINYADLLKSEELPEETRRHYVDVLDRKAQRLKVLIDDLFEASKMASGAVELRVEPVNVAALLEQALAEFSDGLEPSSLTFRVHIDEPQMMARLDGKKTSRVFENLIGNAVKYALPHTRIYVMLSQQPGVVLFTVKNVSAYEIEGDAGELLDRFKRGDASRNTEGSGLGLAIAKSIMELQGGGLDIEVDGDLFKVTASFPSAPNTSAAPAAVTGRHSA
ncbi:MULTISPECIES: sensor histidine kinase [Paenibacillus]|uniref:sensor histidine kinase n=1 Tax=Paenibacillus TaxID=44249 RepID=UPI0022B8BB33|nr:HAMP domain-containing sensor histidine kinase [Paenibacillus caseinilyticus]MCZ8520687.1 HAMP domain-containing sensor histidine kinase [Paenibacillus caseinilyticus]